VQVRLPKRATLKYPQFQDAWRKIGAAVHLSYDELTLKSTAATAAPRGSKPQNLDAASPPLEPMEPMGAPSHEKPFVGAHEKAFVGVLRFAVAHLESGRMAPMGAQGVGVGVPQLQMKQLVSASQRF
jgi:hypothetical protein